MTAERIQIGPRECPEELVEKAARLLVGGGLVALPTETVYGVAALMDGGEGERRLRALKGRESKPFTLHLGDPAEAARLAKPLPDCARRLAERYWPGSLTLVVEARDAGTVGLRVPSRLFTRAVLRAAARNGAPVAMASANLPGLPAPASADAVAEALGERVDLIVDGGPAELGEASTVVRALRPRLELLRTGTLTAAEVERTACTTVLFLCSGNTCRSPMAELLARSLAAEAAGVPLEASARSGLRFLSAGTGSLSGLPASAGALQAMAEIGLDLGGHRTRELARDVLLESDLVLAMTETHRDRARGCGLGPRAPRVELLDPEGRETPDPFGGDRAAYRQARDRIRGALERRMPGLLELPWSRERP